MMITDYIWQIAILTEELKEIKEAIKERDGDECKYLKSLVQKRDRIFYELQLLQSNRKNERNDKD